MHLKDSSGIYNLDHVTAVTQITNKDHPGFGKAILHTSAGVQHTTDTAYTEVVGMLTPKVADINA